MFESSTILTHPSLQFFFRTNSSHIDSSSAHRSGISARPSMSFRISGKKSAHWESCKTTLTLFVLLRLKNSFPEEYTRQPPPIPWLIKMRSAFLYAEFVMSNHVVACEHSRWRCGTSGNPMETNARGACRENTPVRLSPPRGPCKRAPPAATIRARSRARLVAQQNSKVPAREISWTAQEWACKMENGLRQKG